MEKYLTKKEKISEVRVKDKVLALTDFSGIEAGAKGEVYKVEEKIIMIEWLINWKALGFIKPPTDGFDEEELKYLMFLDS